VKTGFTFGSNLSQLPLGAPGWQALTVVPRTRKGRGQQLAMAPKCLSLRG
jgi:hypothetical protein